MLHREGSMPQPCLALVSVRTPSFQSNWPTSVTVSSAGFTPHSRTKQTPEGQEDLNLAFGCPCTPPVAPYSGLPATSSCRLTTLPMKAASPLDPASPGPWMPTGQPCPKASREKTGSGGRGWRSLRQACAQVSTSAFPFFPTGKPFLTKTEGSKH